MEKLDLCKFSSKAPRYLFREKTESEIVAASVCLMERKRCPVELPRKFRLHLDLSESEEEQVRNAAFALLSDYPYSDMVLKVTNQNKSVAMSFSILRKFQNVLRKVWYEAKQRIYFHPRTVCKFLGTLSHVEELHLDVQVRVLDWCDNDALFGNDFNPDLKKFKINEAYTDVFYEAQFGNKQHDMSSSTSNGAANEAQINALEEEIRLFEADLKKLQKEAAAVNRNQTTTTELNRYKSSRDPTPELQFPQLKNLSFSNTCFDLEWLDWDLMAPNVEHLFVPLLASGAGQFLGLILARAMDLLGLGVVVDSYAKDFLGPLSLMGYSSLRSFIYVQLHPNSVEVLELHTKMMSTMVNLEKFYYAYWIDPQVLVFATTYCKNLTSVTLNAFQTPPLHEHVFPILSNMPNLQHLRLEKMIVKPSMIYFCRPFAKLTELEFLSVVINRQKLFFQYLAGCTPCLKKLTLAPIDDSNSIKVLHTLPHVVRFMRGITTLTISDHTEFPVDMYEVLCVRTLPSLKVLRLGFDCVTFNTTENTTLPDYIRCPNIRKLILHAERFEAHGTHLPFTSSVLILSKIKQLYSSLRVLELLDTNSYTAYDREWLTRFFHPVVLRYKEYKLVDTTINDHLRSFENLR